MWVTRETSPLTFRATEGLVGGKGHVGDKRNLSAHVSSNGGGWWQAKDMWVTKKTPLLTFRATEGLVTGKGHVGDKIGPFVHVLSDGGGVMAGS